MIWNLIESLLLSALAFRGKAISYWEKPELEARLEKTDTLSFEIQRIAICLAEDTYFP